MRVRVRERDNDADNVACVIADANVDDAIDAAIAHVDPAPIFVVNVVVVALAANHVVVAGRGAAPPKAHEKCSRSRIRYRFGRISPRRHCPFGSSSSFLLGPAAI